MAADDLKTDLKPEFKPDTKPEFKSDVRIDNPNFTIIGKDAVLKGEMSFDSSARILGTFEGRMTAKGEVHVAEGAICKAALEAKTVVLEGAVEGNILARERLIVGSKAKVRGDIIATQISVAEGAVLFGQIRVGPSATRGEDGVEIETKPASRNVQLTEKPKVTTQASPAGNGQQATPPWMQVARSNG